MNGGRRLLKGLRACAAARLLALGLPLIALVGPLACGDTPTHERALDTRAVVIGIDGADWAVIDALAASGRLPHLDALRARGVSGPIRTAPDIPLSPVVWTSVATGRTATKHGIAWFLVDRPDGSRVPVRSHNRTARAIWNITAECGLRPVVVGWWATYPAEDVGEGVIVSDALGFHGFGATARSDDDAGKTHPAELFPEVDALVPEEAALPYDFVLRFVHLSEAEYEAERFDPTRVDRRDPRNPIHLFQQYAVTAEGYTAIAEKLLARPFDLFLVYFEQVDSFSHLFMKYAPPKLPWVDDAGFARYRDTVAEWYIHQDALLGRLLAEIDLDTTAVFVLSDHGFKSGTRRIRSEQTVDVRKAHLDHEPDGILLAAGPHIRRGEIQGASVLDVTPTLLHYLGLPVADDMDGKVLENLFEPAFLAAHPVRRVATYERAPGAAEAEVAEHYDEDALDENLAALEALGYVEGEAPAETSPEIHNNLGRAHLRNGDADAAIDEFRRALALDPANASALLNLGSVARLRGNLVEAQHLVERALQVDPNAVGALAELAEIARDRGDLDESIRLYREALAIDDAAPEIHLGLGDSLQRAGRYAEAERVFRGVLELDPDALEARYNLGVTYMQEGRLDDAVREYRAVLAMAPAHPLAARAHNNLADIHLRRGEREQAIAEFERAVAASPVHFESRYNLGVQHLQAGRLDQAIPLLEAAADLEPSHEQAQVALATAYLRKGRNRDAYRSFLLVRRLHPDNWLAPIGLAALHAASEDPERARELLDTALDLGGEPARTEAAGYPVLKPLLEERAGAG